MIEQLAMFDTLTNEIILKPLQNLCLHEIRQAFLRSRKIVFQAATGMGKTIVAAHIIKSALEKGKTVSFIADRIVLCNQTSDVLRRYGIPHGVLQAQNERFDINQPVQVCSIQTLKTRGCPKSDLIIIDEAHVLYKSHLAIMAENPDSYFLGLTATPYAKGMGKHFDFHIEPVPVKQLIANGYLVPFDVYGPSIADLSKLKVRAGEFTEESVGEVFDKADIIGDVVKTWQKLTPGKKTIVFGANIAHIKHLVKQFQEAGIAADQVNAYDTDERDDAIQSFRRGDTTVLCSVEVLTKGFDAPEAEVCVLAVATKSMIKWTQTTGRVLRTAPGKEKAIILDFGGNAERLGFPDDFEFLGLDDGKKKTAKTKEPVEKKPKACPSCDFIKPVGVHVCPACGFAPERIKNVEVSEGELAKLQRQAKKEYSIEDKQSWLAQLNQYAADHKMRRHWKGFYGAAIYAYADKFGTRPSGKIDWNAREPVSEEVKRFMIHRNIAYAKRKAKTVIPAIPEMRA
jgi:superfamily II DNA or RNA helicase